MLFKDLVYWAFELIFLLRVSAPLIGLWNSEGWSKLAPKSSGDKAMDVQVSLAPESHSQLLLTLPNKSTGEGFMLSNIPFLYTP